MKAILTIVLISTLMVSNAQASGIIDAGKKVIGIGSKSAPKASKEISVSKLRDAMTIVESKGNSGAISALEALSNDLIGKTAYFKISLSRQRVGASWENKVKTDVIFYEFDLDDATKLKITKALAEYAVPTNLSKASHKNFTVWNLELSAADLSSEGRVELSKLLTKVQNIALEGTDRASTAAVLTKKAISSQTDK